MDYKKMINEVALLERENELVLLLPIKENKWSIREIIGHLYHWDDYNLQTMVSQMRNGAILPNFPDHDQHNQKGLQSLEGKTAHQILTLFIEKRQAIIEAIEKIDMMDRFTIGSSKRAFSSETFIKIFVKHDAHHLKQIKDFLVTCH